jgi:sulfite dehydrogenase (cytochrome) subunit B
MKARWTALFVIVLAAITAAGFGHAKTIQLPPDNAMAKLKPGPGLKRTEAYCRMCHSTDYIVRQPLESAHAWQAEVAKMIKVYGAPISKADAKVISEYLAFAYGAKTSKNDHQKKSEEP